MRRLLVIGLVAASLAACSRSDAPDAPRAFCAAAFRYEKELERQASKGKRDIERQIELVRKLSETAPAAIRQNAKVFLDAMERVRTDPSVRNSKRVEDAVTDVNRYAAQGCGAYKSNSGGGI